MEEQQKPSIDEMIRGELQRLMLYSKELRDKIESAKTKTKKDLYSKKLKKNNLKLMNIMVALEKIQKSSEEPISETK